MGSLSSALQLRQSQMVMEMVKSLRMVEATNLRNLRNPINLAMEESLIMVEATNLRSPTNPTNLTNLRNPRSPTNPTNLTNLRNPISQMVTEEANQTVMEEEISP